MLFFRSWISNPLRVAAFAPSGRALARLITSEITPERAPVIELGPGTGVFTQALLDRGLPAGSLVLLESGEEFAAMLRKRFPGVTVVTGCATRLGRCELSLDQPAGAVVSGLPLLSMTPRQIMATLSGAFARMRSDGRYYQFTYGPTCPVPKAIMERLGLQSERIGTAALNLPPANVFRIWRRDSAA